MSKIRGGRKRNYKRKGRLSATKQYNIWYHSQLVAGLAPTHDGRMVSVSAPGNPFTMKTQQGYQSQFGA